MKRLLILIVLTAPLCCRADSVIHIFDKDASLPGRCTFYARNIDSSGFSCETESGDFYSVTFQQPDVENEFFREAERSFSTMSDYEKEGSFQSSEIVDGLIHYHVHRRIGEHGFEGDIYAICDIEACIRVVSLKQELVKGLFQQLGVELESGL